MRIVTWNIRGIGNANKRGLIKEEIMALNPDFLILQETKRESFSRGEVAGIWSSRFKEWVTLDSVGASGGIAIIWDRRRTKVIDSMVGEYSVSIHVAEADGSTWWLSGVYGPATYRGRSDFLEEIGALFGMCGPRWCIAGDFNIPRFPAEKSNGSRTTTSMRNFDDLIRDLGLVDPPLLNGVFTWTNFRVNPTCARLDRFLFLREWGGMFQSCRQRLGRRVTSDHTPICLESGVVHWGPAPFRFENEWLNHTSFQSALEGWWSWDENQGGPGHTLMRKLWRVRRGLKSWNVNVFGGVQARKNDLKSTIERLDICEGTSTWNENMSMARRAAKLDLEHIILIENRMAAQKLRVKWAKEGDANTNFFHRILGARKSKNMIDRLHLQSGNFTENREEIIHEIVSFFRALYTNEMVDAWDINGIDWSAIPSMEVALLERDFSEEEIWAAVSACENDKAPGPDGFTFAFIKQSWSIVKPAILDFFADFHTNGVVSKNMNETFICLIPKGSLSGDVGDFRPISLVTSIYKLLAKVLAGRLREVLHYTIAREQNAFVPNRQMLDSVLVASEVIEFARNRNLKGYVLKLDFAKAYDRVDWFFLDRILAHKGFGVRWRKWIQGCISSANYSIMINGCPHGQFKGQRGLRQGDPLSPFLFVLVADVLGRMIDAAKNSGLVEGFKVGRCQAHVTHLQYADDSLLFLKQSESVVSRMMMIVQAFCYISGLKLNLAKCNLMGINVADGEVARAASEVGCQIGYWPVKYLGMPLGGSPLSVGFWEPVLRKIARRLDGWKGGFLSKGGRLTLISAVLDALPTYFMSIFRLPVGVANLAEKLMRDFFWRRMNDGSSWAQVAWEQVIRPKKVGGLGVGNLITRNRALMCKWHWRFQEEPDSLWVHIIKSIYGVAANGWDSEHNFNPSYRAPWKFVLDCRADFMKGVQFRIGDGRRISFWRDVWNGTRSFAVDFPRLFAIVREPNATLQGVLHLISGEDDNIDMQSMFRRRYGDNEIMEIAGLLQRLQGLSLVPQVEDSRRWKWETSHKFSVKSAYVGLCSDQFGGSCPIYGLLWKSKAPMKIKIFAWMLWLEKVNTIDVLQKRLPNTTFFPSRCCLCRQDGESIDHLFARCPFTEQIWITMASELGMQWNSVQSIQALLQMVVAVAGSQKLKLLWNSGVMHVLWSIWAERNRRIFGDQDYNWMEVWESAKRGVAATISGHKYVKFWSWNNLNGPWSRLI